MKNNNWIETKKECEIGEDGKYIVKKVTLESVKKTYLGFEKKELVDFCIRILGLTAIFIPLWLFFQQQSAEKNKQKSLLQIEIYSAAVAELHSLPSKPFGSVEYEENAKKILYDIYPRLLLLNDKKVLDIMKEINSTIEFSLALSLAFKNADIFAPIYDSIITFANDSIERKYPNSAIFFRRNYEIKSNITASINQLKQISNRGNTDKNNKLRELADSAATILSILDSAILIFNNDIYTQSPISSTIDVYSLRRRLNHYRDNYINYQIEFLNTEVRSVDSAIIYSSNFLKN